ncbi:MAG: hypothetical protein KME07_17570 [Pegethrix bostrychoides GSE-TBD4-15B]|jgi:hypothetical protein|uniref:Uncharacterized protein n=1 Tax=Pegethrix bostrychoides GSE-TBD4-15B TaxID=2839662 RepID=A0A951PDZ2_9CYAN|nr:hypothetical protein [Pegethrix bostrychoides GSE-TBD4-15B]
MLKLYAPLFLPLMLPLMLQPLALLLPPELAQAAAKSIAPASETAAPPAFALNTAGVCWLYNLSGYLALDTEGEVVPLQPYCQQQHNWAWHEPAAFWQQFREVATAETLSYSQTLDQDEIEAYAQTICLFLESGGTVEQLTQIQSDQAFPDAFEQAVTLASVNSLCRQYRKLYRH